MDNTPNAAPAPQPEQTPAPQPPKLRGLYRYVNISVGALNVIIAVLVAALLVSLAFGLANRGFTVTFDSRGGTPVAAQTRLHGETLEPFAPPTREGFTFAGWYRDPDLTLPWDPAADTVQDSMTLYAAWQPAAGAPAG